MEKLYGAMHVLKEDVNDRERIRNEDRDEYEEEDDDEYTEEMDGYADEESDTSYV